MSARWAGRFSTVLERPAVAYAAALAAVAAAALVRGAAGMFMQNAPNFMAFFPAILFAAMVAGPRGGAAATLASVGLVWTLFLHDESAAELWRTERIQLGLFAVTGGLTVWLATALRQALLRGAVIEERLAIVQAQALDAFVILEPVRTDGAIVDFTWIYANTAADRTTPGAKGGLTGRRVLDVFPDETGADMVRRLSAALSAGGPDDIEVRRVIDGQERWMRSSALPLADGVAVTFRDVTAQREAEAVARRSRDQFEHIANAAPVMIWMSGPRLGATWFNASWLAFTGRALEAELGRGWSEGVHPEDLERLLVNYAQGFDQRQTLRIEYRLRNAQGQHRWLDEVASPSFDADGTFTGYIGACVDVTERRTAEQALRSGEARVRALVDSLPQLLWSNRVDGFCDYLSPQWVAYTGVPAEQHRGDGWLEAIHPDDRDPVRAAWAAAIAGTAAFDVEYRIRRHDGAWRWFSGRASAVREEDGAVRRWFGSSSDITEIVAARSDLEAAVADRTRELQESLEERARAEAALAQAHRLETLGRLTGGVAHDFNNLLTVIIGGLDMILKRPADTERVTRLAEAALSAGRRGERLTRQLLAFARRQELKPEIVDLSRLIAQAEPLVLRAVGAGVELSLELEPEVGAARLDPAQFEAALLNLVVNAADAVGDRGRVTVRAQRRQLELGEVQGIGSGPYVAISVTDTGPGMSPEVIQRAFEPFFTTKEVGKGTGLGLAQVYGFISQCGGAVAIDSSPGEGATVTLYVPVAEGTAEPEAEAPDPPGPGAALSAHVLLVEDDEAVRAVTESLLAELGCRVTAEPDARGALSRLIAGEAFDLMLSDIVMPGGMSGVELAQAAAARDPDLPILLTTGYAGDRFGDGAAEVAWPVLRKPFRADQLEAMVRDVLALAEEN
ncbi:PAS domain-containing sensor histidine kinase [Phenylobacterium aquaticum]|uniref:hybrid sensor histidine kinase/response regulator n=1 Tax=Phenylobacterium aquaticum TaxID=1763816 RepID=UPI0026EEFFE4|nr:PAS domain-containing sensor histidine kinase [Phenylobacterium aquaticum]